MKIPYKPVMKMVLPVVKEGMRLCCACFILFSLVLSVDRARATEKGEPLRLIHADRLLSSGEDGDIVNLVGNVHLVHEGVDLYSERATWYRRTGLVQFIDSVIVIDERRTINANSVTYYRRDRRVTATGEVRMRDSAEDLLLTCEKADYYRSGRQFNAIGEPLLIFHPDDDSARMEISAKRMEYFADENEGIAYDSVTIVQKEMMAVGGIARFTRDPEGVVLTKDPVVHYEENRLTGDSISIFTRERRVDRLLARGNAGAFYRTQPDTLFDEYTTADLTGKELEAFFVNDKISKAVMRDNAVSIYTPAITDTLTRGVNKASGDSITIFFGGGYIKRVHISGGARGEYVEPEFEEEGTELKYDTTLYFGSEIDYSFEDSEIRLLDNGELRYKDMILNAGDIRYGIDTKILTAEGISRDYSQDDPQLPVLIQGSDKLDGEKMSYNLDTKKGQVTVARTKFEDGIYDGERIRQVSDDVLFVSQSNYTSCDRIGETHYHFHSDRMKMIGKDKVVARPVILYIGDLPVFAVPYYVFPVRKGRHSGFLTFEVGNFERGERFIRNLGYYWAASQYWDLETSIDFYENVRTIFNSIVNYGIRYKLRGSVGLNFSRETAWADYKKSLRTRWRVSFNHSHEISPTVRAAASGNFVSDKTYIEDNVYDQAERLDKTVRSTGNITKRWKSSSLVLMADQSWNLDTDEKRELLPSVSFTLPSFQVFPVRSMAGKRTRIKPWEEQREAKERFYNSIYFSLRSDAKNSRQRLTAADSTLYWKRFQTIHTSSSVTSPQRLLGVITVNPGMNFTYTVYHVEWNRLVDSLGLETDRSFTRYTYGLSVAANTSIYGTVYPNILGITGLRHVITPTISYRFTPEIEKNEEYRAYTGAGASSRRSKSISYSLDNLFQSKYVTGEKENKLDLFTLRFNGNYDFVREEKKIGDLRVSLRTAAIPHVSVDYNSVYSFYNFDDTRRSLKSPMMVSSSITTSLKGGIGSAVDDGSGKTKGRGLERGFERQTREKQESGAGLQFLLSHKYSISKSEFGTTRTQWLNTSLSLYPTPGWNISYHSQYDIKEKKIASQGVDIGRDMHCWQGEFTWIPSGPIAGYYIKINIKSLPDIKLEKSEGGVRGGRSGRGFFPK
jgi:lipopolysaccharide assembly outer membrane protein LptD (OstA)